MILVFTLSSTLFKISTLEEAVDDSEFEVGVGFVVCQKFLTSVYGLYRLDKKIALNVGPRHSERYTKAQLVNHAANYWKHRDEWDQGENDRRQSVIEEALKSVGVDQSFDPLMGVLTEISSKKPRFESLVDELEAWAYEVEELCNQSCQ